MLFLLAELIRKDVKMFFADRRALIISFTVPVFIASFMAVLFGNMGSAVGGGNSSSKVFIAVSAPGSGPVTQDIQNRLQKSERLNVKFADEAAVRRLVKDGKASYGLILPSGFGEEAADAMGTTQSPPALTSISDPAHQIEGQVARGVATQAIMGAIVNAKYGAFGVSGQMPFQEKEEAQKAAPSDADNYNGVAHAFSGMAMQGLLFWAIESAMVIMRERKQGIWRRLRAAPVSPAILLLGKLLSGAIRAAMVLTVVFGAGALIFHMRIDGSWLGFALISASAALMASAFGLFVAALGRTEQQSRGLSILAVLTMMMLGGAWFPSFLMPQWIQNVALAVPVRWAVDGFDGMTWRAQGALSALPYAGVLLGFTLVFALVAVKRIRWEYEA
jgi:ABC-2 type transport system permease protein